LTTRLRALAPRVRIADTRSAKPPAKTAAPFYLTPEWRALMARLIKERGRRCEDSLCKMPHRTGIRVFGDHIVEIEDGGALLDAANILLRCGSCHTRKTAEARARRQER
jgi:5-methylcytosine-specific restriction protein A